MTQIETRISTAIVQTIDHYIITIIITIFFKLWMFSSKLRWYTERIQYPSFVFCFF